MVILVDDVTKLNQGLINRLMLHDQIKSGWYFNGSVYGLTTREERVRFDIYDDIHEVISDYRKKRSQR